MNKVYLIKVSNLFSMKDTAKRMEVQDTDGEKICPDRL